MLLALNKFLFIFLIAIASVSVAQDNLLKNGSFESSLPENEQLPSDWMFPGSRKGYSLRLVDDDPLVGERVGLIDSTQSEGVGFVALNQLVPHEDLRGKRVRFRAAVRTDELAMNGRAQLWLRVDKMDGTTGAFDNMQMRPITSSEWEHYEIVADVDEDAKFFVVGMLVSGKAKAWIDDASLEIVDDTVQTTAGEPSVDASVPEGRQFQPFFTPWLFLAAFVLTLLLLPQFPDSVAQRFGLRFSIVYWFLYSTPVILVTIGTRLASALALIGLELEAFSGWIQQLSATHVEYKRKAVDFVSESVLGNQKINYVPSGSGDKTEDYVYLLICFAIAFLAAIIWSLLLKVISRWHSTASKTTGQQIRQFWCGDLLRSYLRYVLAFTMLSYGLAKTGFINTQFASGGVPNEFQLNRTYGASSPMGLLWTFMAASPAYTFFAGFGEVLGCVLLVFRRTATLGALVTFGVMLNVVMLNFCYDVPVKQYSFHLLLMAVVIASADFERLVNVLFFNRSTEPSKLLRPPYTTQVWQVWTHRVLKFSVVLIAVLIPIFNQAYTEFTHEHPPQEASQHLLINRGFHWVSELPYHR